MTYKLVEEIVAVGYASSYRTVVSYEKDVTRNLIGEFVDIFKLVDILEENKIHITANELKQIRDMDKGNDFRLKTEYTDPDDRLRTLLDKDNSIGLEWRLFVLKG